jgi:FkbM family methyltransferase
MIPYFLNKFSNKIDGVIHVGAHHGQEIIHYRKYTFEKIIFFEPIKEIFDELIQNIKDEKNVECHNFGLGSSNDNKIIYKSTGNQGKSSSVLSPDVHLKVQPNISFDDTEEIIIKRFDSLGMRTLNFLVIDVQGFELEVLKGFGEELEKVEFIFTEINTKYLYEDNALVEDIDRYLEKYDFVRVFTNIDCFNHYGDAFYVKLTNDTHKKSFYHQLGNKVNISNYYLYLKRIMYPKKLLKSIIKK